MDDNSTTPFSNFSQSHLMILLAGTKLQYWLLDTPAHPPTPSIISVKFDASSPFHAIIPSFYDAIPHSVSLGSKVSTFDECSLSFINYIHREIKFLNIRRMYISSLAWYCMLFTNAWSVKRMKIDCMRVSSWAKVKIDHAHLLYLTFSLSSFSSVGENVTWLITYMG